MIGRTCHRRETSILLGMNVAVVGYATEGIVSYQYFTGQGHDVTICDQNPSVDVPEGARAQLGEGYLENLDRFELIVRSAGIHPKLILEKNTGVASRITTAVNEFITNSPTRNIIGVTGTKGKGTTSTLITKMLQASGKHVELGGNIGTPPFTFLSTLTQDSWVVLELSSFQLLDLRRSPHIAVCLLVVPEHLDWHTDIDEYLGAKSRLFEWQNSDDVAIYYAKNERSHQIAQAGAGRKLPYYESPGAWVNGNIITIDGLEICTTDEVKLLGAHNWQNICAAITAVWQTGMHDIAAIRSVITTFTGLPHRIEFIREVDGIRYYNDSFATGLHATIAAINAVPENKIVILGGYDRMLPLEDFAAYAKEHAESFTQLLLIGASGPRLAEALRLAGVENYTLDIHSKTMPEIVTSAQKLARKGDAILLSPGFASFDMFDNFADRGDRFRQVVQNL